MLIIIKYLSNKNGNIRKQPYNRYFNKFRQ